MNSQEKYATLGIDIGSTTVKIAILDEEHNILFSDYERHFANIRETLSELLKKAYDQLGELQLHPMITGSGGLTLAKHLGIDFVQPPRRSLYTGGRSRGYFPAGAGTQDRCSH